MIIYLTNENSLKMKFKRLILLNSWFIIGVFISYAQERSIRKTNSFNIKNDFLLLNFDCKTDVDDLQSIAGFMTLASSKQFSSLKFHAVAGTYGVQEGLYVPPNELFQLAFNDNWTDAHKNLNVAVIKVMEQIEPTLKNGGNIWIAEAGQSDFTALLIKAIQLSHPTMSIKERIHVVQHSDWNEEVTTPEFLNYAKRMSNYHKIPDGNALGNGTPGFRSQDYNTWRNKFKNPDLIAVWELAISLSNKYNGEDGRYNNEAITNGGLDFSDLSEVCWILGLKDIVDIEEFFKRYAN